MSLVLDHVALFCEPGAEAEVATLQRAGLRASFGRKHEGQGTSNRLVLFEDNYLELTWIDEPDVAAANPLRLVERSDRREIFKMKETTAITKRLLEGAQQFCHDRGVRLVAVSLPQQVKLLYQ